MWSCPAAQDASVSPPLRVRLVCGLTVLPAFPAPSLFSLTQAFPLIKSLHIHPTSASASQKTQADAFWGFACVLFVFVCLLLCSYLPPPRRQVERSLLVSPSEEGGKFQDSLPWNQIPRCPDFFLEWPQSSCRLGSEICSFLGESVHSAALMTELD